MTDSVAYSPGAGAVVEPWQLRMSNVAIKTRPKLVKLQGHTRPPVSGDCLLITCGDNSGALNYQLRAGGGDGTFMDLEPQNISEMERFLGENVALAEPGKVPAADASFDLIVTIEGKALSEGLTVTMDGPAGIEPSVALAVSLLGHAANPLAASPGAASIFLGRRHAEATNG